MATLIMLSITLKNEMIQRLGYADGARITVCEQHQAASETPILGPTH
jgi:hypothetical protein